MGNFVDRTGLQQGRLTVLFLSGDKLGKDFVWWCYCECGNFVKIRSSGLRAGTKSCGCLLKESIASVRKGKRNGYDITGNRYGKLLVQSFAGHGKFRQSRWNCICDCGTEKVVDGGALINGLTISCGCFNRKRLAKLRLIHGMYKTTEYKNYIDRKRREIERLLDSSWTLKLEVELRKFFRSCVICGGTEKLSVDHLNPLSKGDGLWIDNSVILCHKCNMKKHDKDITDLSPSIRRKLIDASCAFQDHCSINLTWSGDSNTNYNG